MLKKNILFITSILFLLFMFNTSAFELIVHVNDTSSNISGVTVFVYNSSNLGINYTETTNSTGYANFTLNAENYTINTSIIGYFSNSTIINLISNTTVNITLITDSTAPIVNLLTPVNGANLTISTPSFTFNVTDDLDTSMNCSLYINGSYNQSNTSTINNTNTIFSVNIIDGNYNWSISCFDDKSNEYNVSRLMRIDTTAPLASNILFTPTQAKIGDIIIVTFASSETLLNNPNVSVSGNLANYMSITGLNYTYNYTIVGTENQGNITVLLNLTDTFGNLGVSNSTVIIDYTNPVLNSISLNDNYVKNNTQIIITVNATDVHTNISSVIADNILLTQFGDLWNATINLTDSNSYVTILVNDTLNNTITNTSLATYTIDDTAPGLSLNLPTNNFLTNNTTIVFNWTVNDTQDNNLSCNITINNVINSTYSGNETIQTTINFVSGNYNYSIKCVDDADNTVTSSTYNFIVDYNHNPTINLNLSDNSTANNTLVTLTAELFSYSNITLVNYTIDEYTNNLSLTSGIVTNGTWTASVTLSDNATNITVKSVDYFGHLNTQVIYYSIDATPPTTNVSAFNAINLTSGAINLTWTNDDATYSHKIYRNNETFTNNVSEGTLLANIIAGTTFYEDNSTIHNMKYYYAIMSVDDNNNSNITLFAQSNATSKDSIIPKNPINITATRASNNAVVLSWDAVTQDINGKPETGTIRYYVFRNTTTSWNISGTPILNTTNTSGTYNYSDLSGSKAGTLYYYLVVTLDNANNINNSNNTYTNSTVGSSCTNSYTYGAYGSCSEGVKARTGTRICYGLGLTNNSETDSDTTTCSSGSSSGSSSDDTSTIDKTLTASWNYLKDDSSTTYDIPNNDYAIKKIIFKITSADSKSTIKLVSHNAKPNEVTSEPNKNTFKYFEVHAYGFKLEEAKMEFFVDNTWLNNNGVNQNEIVLWHYINDVWTKEKTTKLRIEDEKVYYQAKVNSFSYFAIGSDMDVIVPNNTTSTINDSNNRTLENNTSENSFIDNSSNINETVNDENISSEGNNLGLIIFLIILLLICVIGVYYFYFRPKKSLTKSKTKSENKTFKTEKEALKEYSNRDKILKF